MCLYLVSYVEMRHYDAVTIRKSTKTKTKILIKLVQMSKQKLYNSHAKRVFISQIYMPLTYFSLFNITQFKNHAVRLELQIPDPKEVSSVDVKVEIQFFSQSTNRTNKININLCS